MKIILITDVHAGPKDSSGRSFPNGIQMLQQAVRAANNEADSTLVLLGGDWIHNPDGPEAATLYEQTRDCVDQLQAPWLIIPGNHDMQPDAFYQYFPKPGAVETVGNLRVVACLDEDAPGWCATRSKQDCARLGRARQDWSGEVISFQHMSFHPPGTVECRFNLTNARDVIDVMHETQTVLAVSGHHHAGFHCSEGSVEFVCGAALCESGGYTVIEKDESGRFISRFRKVIRC